MPSFKRHQKFLLLGNSYGYRALPLISFLKILTNMVTRDLQDLFKQWPPDTNF